MFMGLRINNVYQLPADPSAEDVALFQACKRYIDGEQTIKLILAQQSIAIEPTLQKQITGTDDGIYWHPFPIPYPMAGGNEIGLEITRVTSYPAFPSTSIPIVPTVRAVIYAATARADFRTITPNRMRGGAGD